MSPVAPDWIITDEGEMPCKGDIIFIGCCRCHALNWMPRRVAPFEICWFTVAFPSLFYFSPRKKAADGAESTVPVWFREIYQTLNT